MKIKRYQSSEEKTRITCKRILKSLFQFLYIIFELLVLSVIKIFPANRKRELKYEVSLCLIFKDEAHYLKEWIEYHKLIGVDHFYLYNNFSSDNYTEVLQPYLNNGEVTLIDWPYEYAQTGAYENAYNRFKSETKWLGYIDMDEFVNLQSDNSIKNLLHRFRKYPSVFFHWRMFGTSNLIDPPEDFRVLKNYTSCWEDLCNSGKTFINTDFKMKKITSPHFMLSDFYGLSLYPCAMNGIPTVLFKTWYTKKISRTAYLNHYWSKSYREYYIKDFIKGDADAPDNIPVRRTPGRFEYHELKNTAKDFSIQRWLPLLSPKL